MAGQGETPKSTKCCQDSAELNEMRRYQMAPPHFQDLMFFQGLTLQLSATIELV